MYVGNGWTALGQGSGLIHYDMAEVCGTLQCITIFNQDAKVGSATCADHDGNRCGQAECARTGNHQYRNTGGESEGKLWFGAKIPPA